MSRNIARFQNYCITTKGKECAISVCKEYEALLARAIVLHQKFSLLFGRVDFVLQSKITDNFQHV